MFHFSFCSFRLLLRSVIYKVKLSLLNHMNDFFMISLSNCFTSQHVPPKYSRNSEKVANPFRHDPQIRPTNSEKIKISNPGVFVLNDYKL